MATAHNIRATGAGKSRSTTPQTEVRHAIKKKRRLQSEEAEDSTSSDDDIKLEPDMDVDVTGFDEGDSQPTFSERHSPRPKVKRSNSSKGQNPVSKKKAKKKNVVYSEDDEGRAASPDFVLKDEDDDEDDVIPPSPPHPSARTGKKNATFGKGKGKTTGSKPGSSAPMIIKDERKHIPTDTLKRTTSTLKRPRAKERGDEPEEDSSNLTGPSVPTPDPPPKDPAEEHPPLPKKRKLPTIKKNKSLAPTASSSGTPTPVGIAASAKMGGIVAPSGQASQPLARKPAATAGNADIDLTNSEIYKSLFKSAGGSTPKSGLNRREKEEERRKELHRMRDQARDTRMANLKNNRFDLLAAQEKIARFEDDMKERNSVAIFPSHLAAFLKHKPTFRNGNGIK